jgi:hypothetical protein
VNVLEGEGRRAGHQHATAKRMGIPVEGHQLPFELTPRQPLRPVRNRSIEIRQLSLVSAALLTCLFAPLLCSRSVFDPTLEQGAPRDVVVAERNQWEFVLHWKPPKRHHHHGDGVGHVRRWLSTPRHLWNSPLPACSLLAGPLLTQRDDGSRLASAPLLTQRHDGSSLAFAGP